VRNFTLANSTDVYEKSYQPVQLAHNLQEISFPGAVQEGTRELMSLVRQATLRRDDRAPIYPTREQWAEIERSEVLTKLRGEYHGKGVKVILDLLSSPFRFNNSGLVSFRTEAPIISSRAIFAFAASLAGRGFFLVDRKIDEDRRLLSWGGLLHLDRLGTRSRNIVQSHTWT